MRSFHHYQDQCNIFNYLASSGDGLLEDFGECNIEVRILGQAEREFFSFSVTAQKNNNALIIINVRKVSLNKN